MGNQTSKQIMIYKPRILVVDDDVMTRLLARELLSKNDFEIIEAENGRQALQLLADTDPDLVLLDVIMPVMDGFEFLRSLGVEQLRSVPIVMMTGLEDIHCVEQAYQLGATDFITKPVQWLLLPYRIRYVLRAHLANQLLVKQQNQLRQSEERLRLSLSAARQGLWDLNVQTGHIVVNTEYVTMLGYAPDEYTATTLENAFSNLHPDDHDQVKAAYLDYLAGKLDEYRVEFRHRCADGSWRWILSIGSIVKRDAHGQPLRMLGTHTDINDSKLAAEKLHQLAKVFDNSGEGIILCDADNRILSSNQAFTNITGYLASEVYNKTPCILSSQFQDKSFYERMWRSLEENDYWQGEVWDKRKNGETYPVLLGISTIRNNQGVITHYIGIFSDITERKAAEAKIEYLARHDPLTNLPNRTLLRDRFDQAMAYAVRNNTLVALLFLDLDRFKHINDTMGHDVGDRLLQRVAERLSQCVREVDTVCRQGGDEFIIILTDLPEIETATQISLKILDYLHQPITLDGVTISVSFSIGISLFPNDGASFQNLLNKADTAMYVAKKEGRNTFRFFSNEMNLASFERIILENGLRLALEKKEFQLFYQPFYSLRDGHIMGAEALLRWQPGNSTSIPPSKFIPVAENIGLIVPIGNWVLQQACLQNRLWHDAGRELLITVNISAMQFKRGNLVESVKSALEISGLEPRYLELEITESVLIFDADAALDVIQELRAFGVSFAIDNFGTGYSSLSYLKQFAVNKLKIDQSFVKALKSGRSQDTAIAKAIIQLGQTLGLQTLAEGVETSQQAEQMADLGCENGQGFFWHEPMSAKDFEALFKHN